MIRARCAGSARNTGVRAPRGDVRERACNELNKGTRKPSSTGDCLCVGKWRSRGVHGQSKNKRPSESLGGMAISPHLSTGTHSSVNDLKERLDEHPGRLERHKYYGHLLVAVFEDLPMGTAPLLAMMRLPASAEPLPLYHVRRGQGL
jgi:hypothetical protein